MTSGFWHTIRPRSPRHPSRRLPILPLSRRWEWMHFWVRLQRIAGSWWMWSSTRSHSLVSPYAYWCFCMTMQRCLHKSIYLFQMDVSLKFWISGFAGMIFDGYTVQFETMQFNAITARGTVFNEVFRVHCNWNGIGLAIWLNSTVLYMYFYLMQWSRCYALWGKFSGQADTYCMVNVFLQRHSKRGYGSIWIYPVCCDYVWTGIHAAFCSGICIQIAGWCDMICFGQVSPTDEIWNVAFGIFWKAAWCHHVWTSFIDGWERFRGEQHFSRMCFGRWQREWCFCIVWNLFCLAWRLCSTTTTSKLHLFQTVLHDDVFGDTYFYNRVGVAIFVVTAHIWLGGWGGWGGVLMSWRPRPWYDVDNTCPSNLEDALDATLMTWGGVGWGGLGWAGVGWGGVLTSWRPRPWYYLDHTCRGNLEDALDATLMTWGGVGWGGVGGVY